MFPTGMVWSHRPSNLHRYVDIDSILLDFNSEGGGKKEQSFVACCTLASTRISSPRTTR
jgi:hypothetical protein